MCPCFIVFDLDGTLTVEGTRTLISGVLEYLVHLKSSGYYLSVCSNNVMAKFILERLCILDMFDIVIGHPSTSWKAVELLAIGRFYRTLYHKRLIKVKFRLDRVMFVDNDMENTKQLHDLNCGLKTYNSVKDAVMEMNGDRFKQNKLPSVSYLSLYKKLSKEYGSCHYNAVAISALLKNESMNTNVFIPHNWSKTSKYHLLEQCIVFSCCRQKDVILLEEAINSKLRLCEICAYNYI